MAIFQGDVIFRRVIELTLKDIRENDWLIDDILSDFVSDPMLSGVYGQKEIDNAKKWIKENKVDVMLPHRMDVQNMPCVTINIGPNGEDKSLATMADQTPFFEDYTASDIGRTIPYIVEPFDIISYNQTTGFIETPSSVDITLISPGMVIVDPSTGGGYAIKNKTTNGVFIAENTNLTVTKLGILPQYRTWRARRERATFQERITIGCHCAGDPSSLLWLYSFVFYGLLRYREGVLESRNFQLSNLETSDMVRNSAFQDIGENVYSRFITITGQVENTWVKAPKRFFETVRLRDFEQEGNKAGIIIYNEDGGKVPDIIDEECESWVAKDTEE